MSRFSSVWICQQCSYQSPSYLGRCPNCQNWNSFVEEVIETGGKKKGVSGQNQVRNTKEAKLLNLSEIKGESIERIPSGIGEFDRVLGGGIVPGLVALISGEPGIGKSTLLLQVADRITSKFGPRDSNFVLYVSGEESASQIKIRAQRLGIKGENLDLLEETDVDRIINQIGQIKQIKSISGAGGLTPLKLIIVDSVQTLTTQDLSGVAGSVGQIRECAARLVNATKPLGIPLILVGHVTKDGTIAGPKVLEHLVDAVIYIEGERFENLRLVHTVKNRFGPTDEVGVFTMTDSGLQPVLDPHELFVQNQKTPSSGSCLTVTMEGTRPIVVEIQALVTSTPIPNPRRVGAGVDHNRLLTIVAILQKRLNLALYKEDVYVSISGGLKISEPAVDLPIALAIISSYKNKPMQPGTLAIGELDLLGNVRRVNNLEKRIKEGKKMGFKNILTSETLSSLNSFQH